MKNLLAIDDEVAILDLLKEMLTMKGYNVFTTSSAEEANRILRENTIDLILLDVHMPGRSGFSLYREFMARRPVPVLFVTGFPRSFSTKSSEVETMWKNEFMSGTTDILYKPFQIERLFEKVAGLIGEPEEVENGSPV